MEEGEKCTRYFFVKIKQHTGIKALKDASGTRREGTKNVLKVAQDFYGTLYRKKRTVKKTADHFLEALTERLAPDMVEYLQKGWTGEEFLEVIKDATKLSAPGLDGLPWEFYSVFWETIARDFMEMIDSCLKQGHLPTSFLQGAISLLHKKDDKEEMKNWRPITLINVDCKIYAKVLTNRMKKVLAAIIHPDQTCAVPGRRVWDSLITIRDAVWMATDRNTPLGVLSLDLQKAFDSVDHGYMFATLGKFGFPPKFIEWIKMLYSKASSKIAINGFLSDPIHLASGVKQGCPLSPALFVCAMEPLLATLRKEQKIKGIFVPGAKGEATKCVAYMDDVSILCPDPNSVKETLRHCKDFTQASGLALNVDKSTCLTIGSWDTLTKLEVRVTTEPTKILGILFSEKHAADINWSSIQKKMTAKINMWKTRTLSMEGKVLVTKAILLPVLLYVAMVFPPSLKLIKQLQKEIFRFFWGSKMEKLKRTTVSKRKQNGGKTMPDLLPFLLGKFTSMCYRAAVHGTNAAACFVRYATAFLFQKYGLFKVDHSKPACLAPPPLYEGIGVFLKAHPLQDYDRKTFLDQKKLTQEIQEQEDTTIVSNFSEETSRDIWDQAHSKAITNTQKDLTWMSIHGCLPVKSFQKNRGLVLSAECPREQCKGEEDVKHLLWNCHFAKDTWAAMAPLIQTVTGQKGVTYNLALYGVGAKCSYGLEDVLWQIINSVKESLWQTRNITLFTHTNVETSTCIKLCLEKMATYYLVDCKKHGVAWGGKNLENEEMV